ncbi:MAG: PGN_0703 family putative restriction endonuclease [Burkholderiales bacterium]
MASFAAALNRHLAAYKTLRLGVRESGVFMHKGKEVRHGHILPRELRWLNILEPYRAEVRQYVEARDDLKLHKYFHHLNSSQAFAFNLFFPFFENGHSACLLRAMGLPGEATTWHPENIVAPDEGTNVDVSWRSAGGDWTYCEVKLSEAEFGAAKDDKRHREKLDAIYRPVLSAYCPAELLEPPTFFASYQVLRNLWLAARTPGASVVFLLPRSNAALWGPLQAVTTAVSAPLAKRVHIVATEDVLAALASARATPPRLAWYAEQLAEKYMVPDAERPGTSVTK